MIVKKHINDGKLILAICDKELLGKKFEDEKMQLDLTSKFYNGEETSEKEIKELIKQAYCVNAVGKESIEFLKKDGFVEEEHILYVEKVPHAQIMVLAE